MITSSSLPFHQTIRILHRRLHHGAVSVGRFSSERSVWNARKPPLVVGRSPPTWAFYVSRIYQEEYPWWRSMMGSQRSYMKHATKVAIARGRPVVRYLKKSLCKVEFCHSSYDLNDYDHRLRNVDEYEDRDDSLHRGIYKLKWDYDVILKMADDYYGENTKKKLEYYGYVSKTWKPLIDLHSDGEDIKYYQGKGGRPMPLRIPSQFREYDDVEPDEPDSPDDINMWVDYVEGVTMRDCVKGLVKRLKSCNYHRVSPTEIASPHFANNAPMATKDWIVEQAGIDESLARLIMNRPGALQHIVFCIYHFNSLWVNDEDKNSVQYKKYPAERFL